MKLFLLFLFIGQTVLCLQAQEFKINAELRPRYEYLNGFGRMRSANDTLDKAASFVSQRSRLSFSYSNHVQKLRMGASFQDVRNWGATDQLNIGDKNNFSIHEFWGEVLLSKGISTKVGRQELNYDNYRILGNVEWAQQARSFDMALMKYEDSTKKLKIHVGYGLNTKSQTLAKDVYDVNNYKSLQFIWLNKKMKHINASFLFLNNGLEYTVNPLLPVTPGNRKTVFSQTIGGRIEFSKDKLVINTEGYYQGGKTVGSKKIASWDMGVEVVGKPSKNISLIAGAEWLSGTDMNETDGKNHSFNPFYGTNHKFNGTMDYFYVGGRWNNTVGLADYYGGLRFQKSSFDGEFMAHLFSSMAKVVSNNIVLNKNLAVEIDVAAKHKFSDIISFQAGISLLFGTSTLEFITPGTSKDKLNTWAWMQIIIKPALFTNSKNNKPA